MPPKQQRVKKDGGPRDAFNAVANGTAVEVRRVLGMGFHPDGLVQDDNDDLNPYVVG
jgi:hypothetical protein